MLPHGAAAAAGNPWVIISMLSSCVQVITYIAFGSVIQVFLIMSMRP
jgi:hypothetical protein